MVISNEDAVDLGQGNLSRLKRSRTDQTDGTPVDQYFEKVLFHKRSHSREKNYLECWSLFLTLSFLDFPQRYLPIPQGTPEGCFIRIFQSGNRILSDLLPGEG